MKHWHTLALRIALWYVGAAVLWIAGATCGRMAAGSLADSSTSACEGNRVRAGDGGLLYTVLRRVLRTEFEARQQAEQTAARLQNWR